MDYIPKWVGASGNMKDVTGQLKSTEKKKGNREK
jgi:hypothetical protein